jgi:hypothetical protein
LDAKLIERIDWSPVHGATMRADCHGLLDTWLGSSERWLHQYLFSGMSFLSGRPALYHKFLSNVIRADVADYVMPIPVDSLNAAHILKSVGVAPEMIHLDGGHDYGSVAADLRAGWRVLAPGGVLMG